MCHLCVAGCGLAGVAGTMADLCPHDSLTLQELKDFFRDCGEVCYADAHTRKEREGLVEFTHKADMLKALERMNGKELNGRKIELAEDKTTRQRRRSGSSSGGSRSRSRSGGRKARRSRSGSAARKRSGSPAGGDKSPTRKRSVSRSPSNKDKATKDKKKDDASPTHSDVESDGGKKSPKATDAGKSANGDAAKRARSPDSDE